MKKAKKGKPQTMWAIVDARGRIVLAHETRRETRASRLSTDRVVRVSVTITGRG